MKKLRVAINGFGRIGRIFFRQAFVNPDIEIVALNDLGSLSNLAYLLKYDSTYGPWDKTVEVKGDTLVVDGKEIQICHEKEPAQLPWGKFKVDVVVESTGVFDSKEKAQAHLDAGAKRVVISAPSKDNTTPTATPNLNQESLKNEKITSNASCTTNAINPVVAVMMATLGIKKAVMTTVHGYTATQSLVDGPDKKDDFRRGRAAAQNIVPSTTGAAKATGQVIKEMNDKFDGVAIRVPVISGSLIDFTFVAARPTTVEEVNDIFRKAAANPEWQGILQASDEQLVSTDILGNSHGSIVNLDLTKVVDGDLVKVFAWYDNEWGYSSMLVKHVLSLASLLD
ncbi:MAG: type I glyceraldehyde-3-phosphate dehydrogenase [bacterium]|nr:type I glyceraldehyde-3-phosphate dehydrogenase [bacterium]